MAFYVNMLKKHKIIRQNVQSGGHRMCQMYTIEAAFFQKIDFFDKIRAKYALDIMQIHDIMIGNRMEKFVDGCVTAAKTPTEKVQA